MASRVEHALANGRVLLCEAGTGTGKTLAYLVPALLSGRKVVISTATRALQEQIFSKDLPLVAATLGIDPRAALMKGLGNYLCLRRYHQLRRSPEASRPSVSEKLARIERWAPESDTGDLGELAALGDDDPVLAMVASSSHTRIGAACPYHGECFVTRMKRDAEAARIVVVNHHLFFADLALRGPHPGRVLPDYDAVIFDEAHQLEDIATLFFGVRVSDARVEHLLAEAERSIAVLGRAMDRGDDGALTRLVASSREATRGFFEALGGAGVREEGRARVERAFWTGPAESAYYRLDTTLEGLAAHAQSVAGRIEAPGGALLPRDAVSLAEGFEVLARRARSLREDLAALVDGAPGRITWFEAGGRSRALSASPVDVSDTFRELVFESIGAVVLTSATLASGRADATRPFRYLESRLGLEEATGPDRESLIVPSPFDYEQNTLLYCPDDLPEPTDPAYAERAIARTAELIELTEGGVFVLATSLRSMRVLHRGLAERVPGRRLFVQGAAPKTALLSAFRADRRAVLVATMSFWQGVDVPGDALRLVVIDKLPFPVPTDPLVKARGEAIEAAGGNAFFELSVPVAKIALKQGFGRLVRTRSDFGVVALLDARVHRRGYGRKILEGLPPAGRTRDLDDVRRFWQERTSGSSGPGEPRRV
jgi:ATP-dependent DNA helicase DinG